MEKTDYRYPGSRPFTDTHVDRRLFFGRGDEKQSFFHMALAEKLVVIYAKSGMGKTSLLNAGIMKELRAEHYLPLLIRFNIPSIDPLQSIYAIAEPFVETKLSDEEKEQTLWEFFKTVPFWSSEDDLLTPILILDQFEELFTLHSKKNREKFITQLADLVRGRVPKELPESKITKGQYTETSPKIKIIISIREDFLGELDDLSREIPGILQNRFRLLPLNRKQAEQAIIEPAQVKDDRISIPKFKYTEEAVKQMLSFLCKRRKKKQLVSTNEVEPSQLQLLCQHMENKILNRMNRDNTDPIIKEKDLGGEKGMNLVLQNFYDNQVNQTGSFLGKTRVRKLCEKGLIGHTGRRVSLEEEQIEHQYKISKKQLSNLVKCRLLRSEPRVGSTYYELSHDTLIKPIQKSSKSRARRKTLWLVAICFIFFVVLFGTDLYQEIGKSRIEKKMGIAQTMESQGTAEEAIKIYKEIIKDRPDTTMAYHNLGRILYKLGRYDAAIKNYNKAIEINPENADAYNNLGNIFYSQKKYKAAIESYNKAIEISPEYADAYYNLGLAFNELGNYDNVIKNYNKVIDINPKNADAYYNLGLVFNKLGNYDNAIKNYNKVIEINPEHADAYNNLGNIFHSQKKYKAAIESYKKAININPKYAIAYNNQGTIFYNQKKYKAAIESYKKAIKIYPKYAIAYYNLGLAFNVLGNYDKAIESYTRAIEINSEYAIAYNNLGAIFYNQKKYKAAIESYNKAIDINPEDADAYNNRGLAFKNLGEYDNAIKSYNKAIEINPEDADALNSLYIILHDIKNDYQKAYDVCQKAYNLKPENINTKMNFSEANIVNGYFDKAFILSNDVIKEQNITKESILPMRFIMISSLILQNKQSEALAEVDKFIKDYKKPPDNYTKTWQYNGIKSFINSTSTIEENEKKFILFLLSILESSKPEADKKIQKLKQSFNDLLKKSEPKADTKKHKLEKSLKGLLKKL